MTTYGRVTQVDMHAVDIPVFNSIGSTVKGIGDLVRWCAAVDGEGKPAGCPVTVVAAAGYGCAVKGCPDGHCNGCAQRLCTTSVGVNHRCQCIDITAGGKNPGIDVGAADIVIKLTLWSAVTSIINSVRRSPS